jgi:hypothetical protein
MVKYLGIHFDRHLTWKDHVRTKRKQLDHKTREIKWLIGRHSPLSLENEIIIYKTVLKPIWTYGIELWDCASHSNIEIIQWNESKIFRTLKNAPWYVTVHTLHSQTTHSISPWGFPRKDHYPLHCNCFAPQPTLGPTSSLAAHQTSETTMDISAGTRAYFSASYRTCSKKHQDCSW